MTQQATTPYFTALSTSNYRVTGIPAFDDNYLWLIDNGIEAIAIDPGDAEPIERVLNELELDLVAALLTHHHSDHIGGVKSLSNNRNIDIIGAASKSKLPMVNHFVSDGDTTHQLGLTLQVITLPGHTLEHVGYYISQPNPFDQPLLFVGDTLFVAGCGRVFEGTHQQMYESLAKLKALPKHTQIFCAHEYTLANLRFAEAVEPNNNDIKQQISICTKTRERQHATVPTTLEAELLTNPFLRTDQSDVIAAAAELSQHNRLSEVDVFAQIRQWKDRF